MPAMTGAKRTTFPHPGTAHRARPMMRTAMALEKDSSRALEPNRRVAKAAARPMTISPDAIRTSVA
jgi:hypothetical protein